MTRFFVLVNDPQTLEPAQTTSLLADRLAHDGHETWVASVGGLEMTAAGQFRVRGKRARTRDDESIARWLFRIRRQRRESVDVGPGDVVLVRLNPARDRHRAWAHETALALLREAEQQGIVILNSPHGLTHAGHKLYLARLPERFRPPTLVSRDPDAIRTFLLQHETCVCKPVTGTRGRDVFRIDQGDVQNLNQIVDVLVRDGYAMVQPYVEGADDGDVRLIVMDGKLLEIDGHAAAVRRVPGPGDFRSNVHVGGTPVAAEVTPMMRELCAEAGPMLAADGLFLVGLDVIGSSVVEVNAWSPGGLYDAERLTGADFVGAVTDALVTSAQAGAAAR